MCNRIKITERYGTSITLPELNNGNIYMLSWVRGGWGDRTSYSVYTIRTSFLHINRENLLHFVDLLLHFVVVSHVKQPMYSPLTYIHIIYEYQISWFDKSFLLTKHQFMEILYLCIAYIVPHIYYPHHITSHVLISDLCLFGLVLDILMRATTESFLLSSIWLHASVAWKFNMRTRISVSLNHMSFMSLF